jgi:2-hydroxychromene-2-carboxylate isomerase
MSEKTIRFYFDFISPYAYLAWTQIHELAARYDHGVEAIPILFAALLGTHGQKGPAEIPPKRIYVFKDTMRTAKVLGVPFGLPPSHPFNPLLALRIVSSVNDPVERRRVVDLLFRATWGGGPGVNDPETVRSLLDAAGFDGAALVARAQTAEVKTQLKAETDRAIADGAFGVPTLIVRGELFWGYDSFGHIERRLRGEDPIEGLDLDQWRDLPASATRRIS